MKEWITSELIPVGYPVLMVDRLHSASTKRAATSLHISESNIFNHEGYLSEPGIIEHIAQSAYCMIGACYRKKGLPLPRTHIGEVRRFSLTFLPKIHETLETEISVTSKAPGAVNISACCKVDGETAVTCQMKIFIEIVVL